MEHAVSAPIVRIPTKKIVDWESFHAIFAEVMGFPAFYGRNMNAWIDCMSYLDDPEAGMSTVPCAPGAVVTLDLEDAAEFAQRCPELYAGLIESTAFVNWRRVNEQGLGPLLALSFYR